MVMLFTLELADNAKMRGFLAYGRNNGKARGVGFLREGSPHLKAFRGDEQSPHL
jgi:hypothetical protein